MSAAQHDHFPHGSAAHDDDHVHAFDGEPVQELPADEPRTPGWLPALGLMLLLAVVVGVLATRDEPAEGSSARSAATTQAAAAATPQAPPAERPMPPPRPSVAPPPSGSSPLQKLTPEQARDIQKRIEQIQKQRAGATAAPGGPPPTPGH